MMELILFMGVVAALWLGFLAISKATRFFRENQKNVHNKRKGSR